MSQFRRTEISKLFTDWATTGRYNAPRDFRGNDNAEKQELEGLISVLLKMAPQSDYMPWLREMIDRLEDQLKARVWPNKNELGAVCSNLRKERPSARPMMDMPDMSDAAIYARRMNAPAGPENFGVPIGALYGLMACEMIGRGLVSESVMKSFRSVWFLDRCRVYTKERALADEAIQIAKHEAAKEIYRQRNADKQPRDVTIPNKSVSAPVEEWA